MIIGVTALARAGKDTFADYLVEKYKFKKLNMSDVLKDELIRRGKEVSKLNMSLLGDELRSKFGKDIVIKKVFEKAHDYKDVVISGIRSPEEAEYLKVAAPHFFLVAIEANQGIRFGRRTELDPQRKVDFFSRDQIDIEHKGLGEVMAIADYKFKNENSFEALHSEIEEVMEKIRQEDSSKNIVVLEEKKTENEAAKKKGVQHGLVGEGDVMYS